MKNVYDDYKIENDTPDQKTVVIEVPQEIKKEKPKKILYDKKGNIREDKTEKRIKLIVLLIFIVLLQIYLAQCLAKEMGVIVN